MKSTEAFKRLEARLVFLEKQAHPPVNLRPAVEQIVEEILSRKQFDKVTQDVLPSTMTIEYPKRGTVATLKIPASRPIKTLDGVLHEADQPYKVLGTHGTLVRLSRVSDCAKLMVTPDLLNY